MRRLPIAPALRDRLPIGSRLGRRFARGGHYGGKVVRFLQQCRQPAGSNDSRFREQLEPQSSFIGFLFNGSDFGDEFGFASSAAGRAIIRGHRCATANDLFGDYASGIVAFGNTSREFNNPEGEVLGSLLQFDDIHARKLSNQSPIANCQSPISL